MNSQWIFPETSAFGVQGRDLSEDNFAQEERTNLEILMREALQNTLDARAPDNEDSVRVSIQSLASKNFDSDYLNSLLPPEYWLRLEAASGQSVSHVMENASVLVIEDFGTTGLQGTYSNVNSDGPGENWNAFWFREGEGAKSAAGSNGRAGQGKITYYRASSARAIFGMTIRKSDDQQLLMGRSAFRRVYQFGNEKFLRHAFWTLKKGLPTPETASENIEKFKKAFNLQRKDEPGLSVVIPFAAEFDPKEALQTLIAEFFYPIARGRLEVIINGKEINKNNIKGIADLCFSDELAQQKRSAFTSGFRELILKIIETEHIDYGIINLKAGWEKNGQLNETSFENDSIEELRKRLENGEIVSVRCPLVVKSRADGAKPVEFDVHIQVPEDLPRVEEAYIRKDLLIGSERHLSNNNYLQKARGVTLIHDPLLSAFMADAEEPTHLKWNASRPRLAEDYVLPAQTVSAVRNAMPKILGVLSGGIVKRDLKALAKYFTKPSDDAPKKGNLGEKKGKHDINTPVNAPKAARKPFVLETGTSSVKLMPRANSPLVPAELPFSCSLQFAYEGLDQDPFDEYHPFDFDLADASAHIIKNKGIGILSRSENIIEFLINQADFSLEIHGFDPNIRLRARLNYPEKENG